MRVLGGLCVDAERRCLCLGGFLFSGVVACFADG